MAKKKLLSGSAAHDPLLYLCLISVLVFAALASVVLLRYPTLTMFNPYRIPFSKEYWFAYLDSGVAAYSNEELLVWKCVDILKSVFTYVFLIEHYEVWNLEHHRDFAEIPKSRFLAAYLAGGLALAGYAIVRTRWNEYRLSSSLTPVWMLAILLCILIGTIWMRQERHSGNHFKGE